MNILNWTKTAKKIREKLKERVEKMAKKPNFTAILLWNNPASRVYVWMKEKACWEIWILHKRLELSEETTQKELIKIIEKLNEDEENTWIMVQLPLPKHIYEPEIIKAINPKKDVDWFTAYNLWKVFLNPEFEDLPPATPAWIIRLLDEEKIDVKWMNAVVIWRSNIVWKPIWTMLLNRSATVTTCHSKTKNINFYTKNADIIIVAVWIKNFLKKEMVKDWVIIVDVWIHRNEDKTLSWDVDFENVKEKASFITPVPGWVWPMTVAQLMTNIVNSAENE